MAWAVPPSTMNESAVAGGMFRQIVEEARDLAIFVLDEEGVIELWNIGAERTFGWTAPEIVGRNFEVLFTADDRRAGAPQKELAKARETGRAGRAGPISAGNRAVWLGREDSNLRMAAPKAAALPLGDSPSLTSRESPS